ncbi:MAG TPA: hypothetical protein VKH46_00695 [Thermoanaerobaculia bacterium]|nr:hypothetical protein [Thermoanaerobaculia bacterium]
MTLVIRRVILFLGLLAWAAGARAGWVRIPVLGADVTAIASDPFRSDSVFCGTSRGNVYHSSDGGRSWGATRPGNQFPGYVVSTLKTDVRTPGRLWAALSGTGRGALLAVSDDDGADWTILARWDRAVDARAFAQSPLDPQWLACGGDDGVFLSRDGGRSWTPSGEGVAGLALVQSLAFDPADRATLYAGTYRQAFRTRDAGETWARIANGMVLDATVYSFDFDPHDASRVWVSTCGWVYRSDDGGDRWTRFTTGFTNRRTPVVHLDPKAPNVLYAGTVGGLHRSDDGGKTWNRISRETLDVSALEVDPRSGCLYLGSLGEGMFYSDDRGATIVPASDGLDEARVPAIAPDPADPSRVLFLRAYGGVESGVWETAAGASHQISSDSPPGAFALAAATIAGRTVWLTASASSLLVSTDSARRFFPAARPPEGRILKVFGDPLPAPIVVTERGAWTTADGATWRKIDTISGTPVDASLVSDATGRTELEVRTTSARFRGTTLFEVSRRPLLSGGMYRKTDPAAAAHPFFRYDVRDSRLVIRRGTESAALELPRGELRVTDAIIAGDGSLYVSTMGDGVFRYTPDNVPETAAGSSAGSAKFR